MVPHAAGGLIVSGAGGYIAGTYLSSTAIASLLAPALLTVANSRMALPALALALPFAGHGAARLAAGPQRGRALAVLAAVAALLFLDLRAGATLAPLEPSSHYRALVAKLDHLYGTRTAVSDCVELRARGPRAPEGLRIELRNGYRARAGGTAIDWQPRRRPRLRLRVVAERPAGPLELALVPERPGAKTTVALPIGEATWMGWTASGARGVEMRWCGGGRGTT